MRRCFFLLPGTCWAGGGVWSGQKPVSFDIDGSVLFFWLSMKAMFVSTFFQYLYWGLKSLFCRAATAIVDCCFANGGKIALAVASGAIFKE